MTKDNWVTVGKVACVSLTVASIVAGYYGVKAGVKFINKNMSIKKMLIDSRKIMEKSFVDSNKPIPYDEVTDKLKVVESDFKKISPESFLAFVNWFDITIPYGKNKSSNAWNYQDINPAEYDAKKAALIKNEKELNETKLMEHFNELEKLV